MNTTRKNEIMDSFTAFKDETYRKKDLLDEYFLLQEEMVKTTFSEDHANAGNLKIWDVIKHLEQMNEKSENIAEEELNLFKKKAWNFSNYIKSEVCGNRGEVLVYNKLKSIDMNYVILKNIELNDDTFRTELDDVVILNGMVIIIETKNHSRNIFISEDGDFYKTGEYSRLVYNISDKLKIKEMLVKAALDKAGINDITVKSILCFTDSSIEVHNKCTNVKNCFLAELPMVMEALVEPTTEEFDMELIKEAIVNASCELYYPPDMDMNDFKVTFANVLVKLEETSKDNQIFEEKKNEKDNETKKSSERFNDFNWKWLVNPVAAVFILFTAMIKITRWR